MYNGQVISVMLKERGLRAKDLLDYLQIKSNGSLSALVHGNPTAERLEKIADFFEVPIDSLFSRSKSFGYNVVGNRNNVGYVTIGELRGRNEGLEKIIEEKDKRIALLEEMVTLLKGDENHRLVIDNNS